MRRTLASPSIDPSGAKSIPRMGGLATRPASSNATPADRCKLNARPEALGFTDLLPSTGLPGLCERPLAGHFVDRNRRTDLFPHHRFDRIHDMKSRIGLDVAVETGASRMALGGRLGQVSLLVE